MNLFDSNTNNITMIIDGQDIEMKPAICYNKVYANWLVSKCGKVWSVKKKKILTPYKIAQGYTNHEIYAPEGFWEDGSGRIKKSGAAAGEHMRSIRTHKMIMDTWKPLYDNPPEGIVWEEWEIVRDLPTVYDHISKTVVIDHINNIRDNNHIDNLRRTNSWENQKDRKLKGLK